MARRFRALRQLVDDPSGREALSRTMESFVRETLAHFEVEETTIFPLLAGVGGVQTEPAIRHLEQEHLALRQSLDAFQAAVASGREVAARFEDLREKLFLHAAREESLLYPIFDELCPASLRPAVTTRVRAVRSRTSSH